MNGADTVNSTGSEASERNVHLSGISVVDPDGSADVLLTLEVSAGGIVATATDGVTIDGSGSSEVTIEGTVDEVNAFLATTGTLSYTAVEDNVTTVILTGTVEDLSDALTDTGESTLTCEPTEGDSDDGAVSVDVPGGLITPPDSALAVEGVSVGDTNADTSDITLTLEVNYGTLTLSGFGGGTISGNGTADVSVTGSLDAINADLSAVDGLVYNAPSGGTLDTLEVTAVDLGNSDESAVGYAPLTVDSPPVANPDSYSVTAGSTLTKSAAAGVLSSDSGSLSAVLASQPANGTVTLQPNGAFVYTPDTSFAGTDSFTYEVSDGLMLSAGEGDDSGQCGRWVYFGWGAGRGEWVYVWFQWLPGQHCQRGSMWSYWQGKQWPMWVLQ